MSYREQDATGSGSLETEQSKQNNHPMQLPEFGFPSALCGQSLLTRAFVSLVLLCFSGPGCSPPVPELPPARVLRAELSGAQYSPDPPMVAWIEMRREPEELVALTLEDPQSGWVGRWQFAASKDDQTPRMKVVGYMEINPGTGPKRDDQALNAIWQIAVKYHRMFPSNFKVTEESPPTADPSRPEEILCLRLSTLRSGCDVRGASQTNFRVTSVVFGFAGSVWSFHPFPS